MCIYQTLCISITGGGVVSPQQQCMQILICPDDPITAGNILLPQTKELSIHPNNDNDFYTAMFQLFSGDISLFTYIFKTVTKLYLSEDYTGIDTFIDTFSGVKREVLRGPRHYTMRTMAAYEPLSPPQEDFYIIGSEVYIDNLLSYTDGGNPSNIKNTIPPIIDFAHIILADRINLISISTIFGTPRWVINETIVLQGNQVSIPIPQSLPAEISIKLSISNHTITKKIKITESHLRNSLFPLIGSISKDSNDFLLSLVATDTNIFILRRNLQSGGIYLDMYSAIPPFSYITTETLFQSDGGFGGALAKVDNASSTIYGIFSDSSGNSYLFSYDYSNSALNISQSYPFDLGYNYTFFVYKNYLLLASSSNYSMIKLFNSETLEYIKDINIVTPSPSSDYIMSVFHDYFLVTADSSSETACLFVYSLPFLISNTESWLNTPLFSVYNSSYVDSEIIDGAVYISPQLNPTFEMKKSIFHRFVPSIIIENAWLPYSGRLIHDKATNMLIDTNNVIMLVLSNVIFRSPQTYSKYVYTDWPSYYIIQFYGPYTLGRAIPVVDAYTSNTRHILDTNTNYTFSEESDRILICEKTLYPSNLLCKARFVADIVSGFAPLTVNFTNLSEGSIDGFIWDFGDGFTDDMTWSPSHVFTQPGVYKVSLKVFNAYNSDIMEWQIVVNLSKSNDLPRANLIVNPIRGTPPLTVYIQDISEGIIAKRKLDFGDNSSPLRDYSPLTAIEHSYQDSGVYRITLKVSDSEDIP